MGCGNKIQVKVISLKAQENSPLETYTLPFIY